MEFRTRARKRPRRDIMIACEILPDPALPAKSSKGEEEEEEEEDGSFLSVIRPRVSSSYFFLLFALLFFPPFSPFVSPLLSSLFLRFLFLSLSLPFPFFTDAHKFVIITVERAVSKAGFFKEFFLLVVI